MCVGEIISGDVRLANHRLFGIMAAIRPMAIWGSDDE
jgi:hypothetical protein